MHKGWDHPTFIHIKMAKILKARTEFASALNQICAERGIKPEVVLSSIRQAILAAYRKDEQKTEDEVSGFQVELDPNTGATSILNQLGENVTPAGFGRIAAQTAKQVILQGVREAEKDAIITEYQSRIGTVTNGMILRFEGKTAIVDIGRAQAVLPPEEQATDEYYRLNQRISVYIKEIRETPRGQQVVVSRSDPELVRQLFAREVPEVASGAVTIRAIAREAGRRTKVAVDSTEEGVDPVGSCVGQKGVRVQAVINQLGGEKIDIIQYDSNPREFIRAALAPAEGLVITLEEKKKRARVVAPEDQQSIAIGRGGQNVRLASMLTDWDLNVVGNEPPGDTPETADLETPGPPEDTRTLKVTPAKKHRPPRKPDRTSTRKSKSGANKSKKGN